MLVSVIVPAYNEEKYLGYTLEKVKDAFEKNNDRDFTWEIIVCDNNSMDKTAQIAADFGAHVVKEPINQISRARNTGASVARGIWLLFIDADSYPKPELMTEVLSLMEVGDHIGCGATVEVIDGTLFNKLRMERLNPFFRLFRLSGGNFILCQKDAFLSIGGFSNGLYAYEEIDFLIRLKRFGKKQGKRFKVFHQFPVITSGRKGDFNFLSIFSLVLSNFVAILLFLFHFIIPEKFMAKLGARMLGYWYKR